MKAYAMLMFALLFLGTVFAATGGTGSVSASGEKEAVCPVPGEEKMQIMKTCTNGKVDAYTDSNGCPRYRCTPAASATTATTSSTTPSATTAVSDCPVSDADNQKTASDCAASGGLLSKEIDASGCAAYSCAPNTVGTVVPATAPESKCPDLRMEKETYMTKCGSSNIVAYTDSDGCPAYKCKEGTVPPTTAAVPVSETTVTSGTVTPNTHGCPTTSEENQKAASDCAAKGGDITKLVDAVGCMKYTCTVKETIVASGEAKANCPNTWEEQVRMSEQCKNGAVGYQDENGCPRFGCAQSAGGTPAATKETSFDKTELAFKIDAYANTADLVSGRAVKLADYYKDANPAKSAQYQKIADITGKASTQLRALLKQLVNTNDYNTVAAQASSIVADTNAQIVSALAG